MYGENVPVADEPSPWFVRLWQRFRPNTGWTVFWLALGAVLLLPAALVNGELFAGMDPVVTLSIGAFVFAWWLSLRRVSGVGAAAILLVTGVVADLLWGVFVLRPGPLVQQIVHWWAWNNAGRRPPEPVITYFPEQAAVLSGYLQRVGWWIKGLVVGPGSPDNLAVIGLIVLLAWCIAAWAAWWVNRRGQPLVGLAPTAVFLAQHAFWAPGTISFVLVFLAVTAFLLVLARLVFNMRAWDAAGVDYAEDIRLDVILTGLAIALIVSMTTPVLPFFASPEFSQRFWALFESPWRKVEQQVSASFQAPAPVRSLVPPGGAAPGGLPRAHLLGAGPELGRAVALKVRVAGDPSNVLLYWRGQTYDTYTGRGWENAEPQPASVGLEAGQPWAAQLPSTVGRRPLLVSVEAVGASRAVLYALAEPVGVDRPYTALLRAPGDLIALTAPASVERYTALSHAPEQNTTTLRAAGAVYPSDVISRYLQLPPNLDPRLLDAARRWTAEAETPYDRAAALERQLRTIPYSLDVPMPPAGRELVAWFLFDLQRGYCDYYASAMIVLARLNGIPARLAIGYATGAVDPATGQYVVTEAQAHSWPELYFPGLGWTPFEPTAYLPEPTRRASAEPALPPPGYERGPEDLGRGMAEIQERAAVNTAVARREATNRRLLTAALGLALLWAFWLRRMAGQPLPSTGGEPVEALGRLVGWGQRLARRPAPGDTPRELAAEVRAAAGQVADRAIWGRSQARAAAKVVASETARLTEDVERRLFGRAEPAAAPAGRSRLWSALRRLWWASRLTRRT